jgi:hypothetical protein
VLCIVVGGLLVSRYIVHPSLVLVDAVTVVGFDTVPAGGENVGVAAKASV